MLTSQSNTEFSNARQRAFIGEWLNFLTGRPNDLLSFEEIRKELRLQDSAYKGLQEIELEKIVGSTGRYRDFNRAFLHVIIHLLIIIPVVKPFFAPLPALATFT